MLLPIIAWVPIVTLLQFSIEGIPVTVKGVIKTFLTDFWFLWAVVLATIYMAFVSIIPRKMRGVFNGICIIGAFFLPDMLWAHAYKYVIPYFVYGYHMCETRESYSFKWGANWVWIFGILLCFYNKQSYIYTSLFSVYGKPFGREWLVQLGIDLYRYAVGIAGCAAVIWICKVLWCNLRTDSKYTQCILWLGNKSMAIYILSTYIFVYAIPELTSACVPNVLLWLLITIVVTSICAAITIVLQKNKFLSKVLIGL